MSIRKASEMSLVLAMAAMFGGARFHAPERSRDSRTENDVADRLDAAEKKRQRKAARRADELNKESK